MRSTAACLCLALMLGVAACNTYADDLSRSQRAFEESEHERALAILRALEPDLGRLSLTDRAHYAYLRGMTDFRLGYKAESRHWLSLAASMEQDKPGSLPPDWAKKMADSLKELNEEVYTAGIEALTNTATAKKTGDDDSSSSSGDTSPAGDSDTPKKKKSKSDDN
jgi:hypothetical protein